MIVDYPRDFSTAVIVLNYKGAADTMACVESLCRLNEPVDVFLVDNASPDGSYGTLQAWGDRVFGDRNAPNITTPHPVAFVDLGKGRLQAGALPADFEGKSTKTIFLVQSGSNGGYAAGNNVGLIEAWKRPYRFFWLLNNDTEVHAEALHWLLARMAEDRRMGLCGSTLLYHGRRDMVQNYGGAAFRSWHGISSAIGMGEPFDAAVDRASIERQMSYVNGASTLVSREFLETVGLMEERYFLYWEEIDWAFRGNKVFSLGFAPKSIVYHKVGASIGTADFEAASPFVEYHFLRNRIFFCFMFSPKSLPYVFASIGRELLKRCLRGSWQRAGLLLSAIGSGSKAIAAFCLGRRSDKHSHIR